MVGEGCWVCEVGDLWGLKLMFGAGVLGACSCNLLGGGGGGGLFIETEVEKIWN